MFCVSVDLVGAEAVVHRRGPLARAVGLSMRLLGVLSPEWYQGHLYVDGGVLDSLPLGVMAEQREGPVVGVEFKPLDEIVDLGRKAAKDVLPAIGTARNEPGP